MIQDVIRRLQRNGIRKNVADVMEESPFLSRRPLRVAGKESVCETDLIGEEDTEGQTQQSGGESQPVRKVRVLFSKEVERGSDAHGNQHHAADGAGSEDEQVNNCPVGVADGCKNQESNRGGPGESVNDSDYQWTELLIETDLAKHAVEPGKRSLIAVCNGLPARAHGRGCARSRRERGDGSARRWNPCRRWEVIARAVRAKLTMFIDAEQDQHESDGKLHRQPDPRRE